MTESIKITAFFRPTSGNLFLPSSFHLLLKRPADGGFGCERTSFHPPFSLLSSVKLLPAFELFDNAFIYGSLKRGVESTQGNC